MIHTAKYHLDKLNYWSWDDIESAIRSAQKEAIRECAKVAKWKSVPPRMTNMDGVEIDKKSILKLLDQIK